MQDGKKKKIRVYNEDNSKERNMGWKFLKKYGVAEVWQTPTKYLACYHYGGIFVFTKTLEEANKIALELQYA